LAPTLIATSPAGAEKWAKLEKREVEVEVHVETKPLQLCSLLLLFLMMMIMMISFLKQNDRIRELRIADYIFTISSKYRITMQAIWRAISFHIQLPISGLNLHVKTHFHTFDISHRKQITLFSGICNFQDGEFWTQHF